MSKSALYAGLGQGLMSLGQGVGNAIQTMTLEDLRKQNMQENWARQDAIRKEDNDVKAEQYKDTQEYRKQQSDNQQTNQEATSSHRTAQLKQSQTNSDRSFESQQISQDNASFQNMTARPSKNISDIQKSIDKVTGELIKAQSENGFTEPLMAELVTYGGLHNEAVADYKRIILGMDESTLIEGTLRFNAYKQEKQAQQRKPEDPQSDVDNKPGANGPSVDDVLGTNKTPNNPEQEPTKSKRYGQSIGDSLGTNQLGSAIGGFVSDMSTAIGKNKLVGMYAQEGAIGMSREQLTQAYQRAKEINEPDLAKRIMDDLNKNNFSAGLMAGR